MATTGRIYQRGEMYLIAYSHGGREFRERTRSRKIEDARRLLDARITGLNQPVPLAPPTPVTRAVIDLSRPRHCRRRSRTSSTCTSKTTRCGNSAPKKTAM